jgi:regulator of sigma E protease
MVSFIITLLIFVFVIGILVFVHELGHYLAAKKVGIKVEEFAIGMGPKIWGFRRGETEYNLRVLPIGGFVKMLGEGDYDLTSSDSFGGKKPSRRLIVLFAGVFMNFLLAILLFYVQGVNQDFKYRNIEGVFKEEYRPWFGEKSSAILTIRDIGKDSPLKDKASTFDLITKINGEKYTVDQVSQKLIENSGKEVNLTVMGYASSVEKDVKVSVPDINERFVGKDNTPLIVIQGFTKDSPLLGKAEVYDVIKEVNGESYNSTEFRKLIESNKGKEVTFTFMDVDGENEYKTTVKLPDTERPLGVVLSYSNSIDGLFGISTGQLSLIEFKNGAQAYAGIGQAFNTIQNFGFSLGQLFGQAFEQGSATPVVDNVGGAIGIFDILSKITILFGFWGVLELMALFSINLAVLNILPIPALDGGHVFFTLIELVTRRKLNANFYNYLTLAGFLVLMTFMLSVTALDLVKYTPVRSLLCEDGRNAPFVCEVSDFR